MLTPTPSDTIRNCLAFAYEAADTNEDRAWVNEGRGALAMMEAQVERLRRALEEIKVHRPMQPVSGDDWGRGYDDACRRNSGIARAALAQPGDANG